MFKNPFTQGAKEIEAEAKIEVQDADGTERKVYRGWFDDRAQDQADDQDQSGYRANRSYRSGRG